MQPTPDRPSPVDNHLTWAVVCIALCWPLAVPAITNAARVNPLLAAGDQAGARHAAAAARRWAKRATVVGIVCWALVLLCCPFGLLAAADPQDVASWVAHLTGHR